MTTTATENLLLAAPEVAVILDDAGCTDVFHTARLVTEASLAAGTRRVTARLHRVPGRSPEARDERDTP